MKVFIYTDEYYPFYDFDESSNPSSYSKEVEMSPAVFKTIKDILSDFEQAQNTLKAYVEIAENKE